MKGHHTLTRRERRHVNEEKKATKVSINRKQLTIRLIVDVTENKNYDVTRTDLYFD